MAKHPSEHEEQAALVQWARARSGTWPCLAKLHSSLNGIWLGGSDERSRRHAYAIIAKQKQAGMLNGVPDLFLPWASRGYHGLYIEMKSLTGKPTPEELEFLEYADTAGFLAVICYGFEEGRQAILDYLQERQCNDRDAPQNAAPYKRFRISEKVESV